MYLLERDAGLGAPNELQPFVSGVAGVTCAPDHWFHGERYEYFLRRSELETDELRRRDSDDSEWHIFQHDFPANDGRVEAKPVLPIRPAHYGHRRRRAHVVILRPDEPPYDRLNSEHGKVVARAVLSLDLLRLQTSHPRVEAVPM